MGGLWPVVLRSLRRRPMRALLTAVAVAIGVAALLGVQVTLGALDTQAQASQALRAGRSQLDVRATGTDGIGPDQVDALSALASVAEAQPLLTKRVTARAGETDVQGVTVTVVGLSDAGEAAMRSVRIVDGRLPRPGTLFEVTLDQGLATALRAAGASRDLRPGDDVLLTTSTGPDRFRVVGISAGTSGGVAFTQTAAYVSRASAEGPLALGLRTPLVALRLRPGASPVTVAHEVHAALGAAAVASDPHAGGTSPLDQLRPLLGLVVLLSVAIGAGVTANTVAVGASERRRDIGLLRAAGASNRQVFRMLVAEAAVVAAAGAAAGVGLGALLGRLLIDRFAATDLPVPAVGVDGPRVLAAVAGGAGAAVLGAVVPAIAVRRLAPLQALRMGPTLEREALPRRLLVVAPVVLALAAVADLSPSTAVVAVATAGVLLGAVLLLPVVAPVVARLIAALVGPLGGEATVAAANLARRRNRTALTVAGLMTAIATATALSTLTAGALDAGDQWIDRLIVGDAVVVTPVPAADGVATAVAATQGVTSVTAVRLLRATVEGSALAVAVVDPRAYADSGRLDVVSGDRTAALVAVGSSPSLLVPSALADPLDWQVGTHLRIDTPTAGPVDFTVAGVVAHTWPSGDGHESLMLGRDVALRYFGTSATGFDDLEVSLPSDAMARLRSVAASYGMTATTVGDIHDAARASVGHAVSLLTALSWVAVVVAMLAVVNTLLVNVRQGARELALLRAVGMARRRALRLVLSEAALLAATSAVLGVGLGCVIALPLLRVSGSPGFSPPFSFPLTTAVSVAAAVVAGSVLAVLAPARRAAGAAIVAAIRHE